MKTKQPNILFEDDSIIVCFKPAGVPTQSGQVGIPDMESLLKNHIHQSTQTNHAPYLSIIHRLDQPVSGLLVFAKTLQAAKALNMQLTHQGFGKYYLALVNGIPQNTDDSLEHYLIRDRRTNMSRVCPNGTPDSKKAILHYKIIEFRNDDTCLLEIHLDTGRHHQIRVQLAHIGCPIVGDTKYNTNTQNKNGWQELKLCAYKLSFRHPVTRQEQQFDISSSVSM